MEVIVKETAVRVYTFKPTLKQEKDLRRLLATGAEADQIEQFIGEIPGFDSQIIPEIVESLSLCDNHNQDTAWIANNDLIGKGFGNGTNMYKEPKPLRLNDNTLICPSCGEATTAVYDGHCDSCRKKKQEIIIDKDNRRMFLVQYASQIPTVVELFARVCSVTCTGMNSGYVYRDGEKHIINREATADAFAQDLGYDSWYDIHVAHEGYWRSWDVIDEWESNKEVFTLYGEAVTDKMVTA